MDRTPEQLKTTLANIARRAETLWADGYRYQTKAGSHIYIVKTPKFVQTGGEMGFAYTVDMYDSNNFTCDCKSFKAFAKCKHLMACITLEIESMLKAASEIAQAAAYDELMGSAEYGDYGIDPYSEF